MKKSPALPSKKGAVTNGVLREILDVIVIILVVVIFRSCFLNWYEIPSGSMIPTLKIGDRVLVNKLAYGFSLPLSFRRVVSWSQPQRGDIVVFHSQEEERNALNPAKERVFPVNLIKRVIGLPGDEVRFENGVLTINGVKATEKLEADKDKVTNGSGESTDFYDLYEEAGFSQEPHHIMRRKLGGITTPDTRVYKVPEGKLLVMGDNRDNSNDGRVWGYVDQEDIYGRAFAVVFSTKPEAPGFLPEFRSDRFFKSLGH